MAIDANIYSQFIKPPKTVQEYDAEALQAKTAAQMNQINAMKMDEYQRGVGETNKLNNLYQGALGADGKIDRNMLFQRAASQGLGSKIPGLQKGFLDTDEAQGKVDKQKIELVDAHLKQSKQFLQGVTTPDQFMAWHEGNHLDPVLGPVLAARGVTAASSRAQIEQALKTPGGFQQLLQQSALGLEKFTELNKPVLRTTNLGGMSEFSSTPGLGGPSTILSSTPITQSADNAASQATSLRNNQNSVNATIRGQDLTDLRSRETNALGKVPAGYRANADGSLTFIPGGPADPAASTKAPTEFQGKSGTFGMRAERADKILNEIGDGYSSAAINSKQSLGKTWLVGGALEAGANVMLSNKAQQVEQAQRDFVNAVLRQESGAAISDTEFENARKQYFAQPGDGAAVIAQKAANRKTSIEGFKNNAGRAGAAGAAGAAGQAGVPSDWTLQKDASGNKAYVSPDGKQFKEVK
jgi:hypothetical protein